MTDNPQVHDVLGLLEEIASFSLAEAWDNVGLMVGSPGREVTGVLIALDPTEEVLCEALDKGANVLITHHPIIFHPLKSLNTELPVGRFLQVAIEKGIAVIGCHTNLDLARGGVNDVLAMTLQLENIRPLAEPNPAADEKSFGRIGSLPEPLSGEIFIRRVAEQLGLDTVAVAGPLPDQVSSVAVCGGSGSELADAAKGAGADIYVTSEVKHSTARWAEASSFCVVDAGHFATENTVVPILAARLREGAACKDVALKVEITERQSNPFVFYKI